MALETATYGQRERLGTVLAGLLAALPQPLVEQAFAAAAALEDGWDRERAVVGLASASGAALIPAAVQVLMAIPDERAQVEGFCVLIRMLPADLVRTIWEQAWAMRKPESRRSLLVSLVAYVPADLFVQVEAFAFASDDDQDRAWLIPALAPQLPPALWERAAEVIGLIKDVHVRDGARGRLVQALPASAMPLARRVIGEVQDRPFQLLYLLQLRAKGIADHQASIDQDLAALLGAAAPGLDYGVLLQFLPAFVPGDTPLPASVIDRIWTLIRPMFRQITRPMLVSLLMQHPPTAERQELYAELVEALCESTDEQLLVGAFTAMIPHLSIDLHGRILDKIQSLGSSWVAARGITALAGRLSPALHAQALFITRGLVATHQQRQRLLIEPLIALAEDLPIAEQQALYQEALGLAQTIRDDYEQMITILGVLPAVRPARRARLYGRLAALPELLDGGYRSEEVLELAEHLPASTRRWVQRMVFAAGMAHPAMFTHCLTRFSGRLRQQAAARLLRDVAAQPQEENAADYAMRGLVACIPALPRRLLGAALRVARRHPNHQQFAQALAMLAGRARPSHQRGLYDEALASIRGQLFPHLGATACAQALPYLPETLAAVIAPEVLGRVLAGEPYRDTKALAQLGPCLPPAALEAAIQRIGTYPAASDRVTAWMPLVPALPANRQEAAYRALFTHVLHIGEMGGYSHALTTLIPHLPPALLPQALEAARQVPNKWTWKTDALYPQAEAADKAHDQLCASLAALLPRLPADQHATVAAEALAAARLMSQVSTRAWTLLRLLPCLPSEWRPSIAAEILHTSYVPTSYDWGRDHLFKQLVPWLARRAAAKDDTPAPLRADWQRVVRGIVRYGRSPFLESLAALTPWLTSMATSAEIAAISMALCDITDCWP
ncbi:MAG TPA: hypothetical protein VGE07_23395 [Herpetosiphonaceae bacterium]